MTGYTPSEWAEVERATRRVARAYGYGSGWRSAITQHAEADADVGNERMSVAHRGHVTEQAARAVTGTGTHVRRQQAWSVHAGIVAVPSASPHLESVGALAALPALSLHLLRAYALQSIEDWYAVEPALWREVPTPNQVMAGRDAMARIMYRCAATSKEARAQQLRVRAADYRAETGRSERVLRDWLLTASRLANLHNCPPTDRPCASQGFGHRTETWWRPPVSGAVFAPHKRPNE